MKYHETDDYSFLLGNNHYVYDYKEDENTLHLFIKSNLTVVSALYAVRKVISCTQPINVFFRIRPFIVSKPFCIVKILTL